jgi:iron-sulfur cluster assembly protein
MQNLAVNITESAKEYIIGVLDKMNKSILYFGMKGGGCAGFEYIWQPYDEETYKIEGTPDRDEVIELSDNKKLIVDCTSLLYTLGSTIDYKSDFISSQLTVINPNSKGGCGCGTSVSF